MVDGLDGMLQFQATALQLRSYRQELLASNIANADTPNYKAVDFDFATALRNAADLGNAAPRAPGATPSPDLAYRIPAQTSLDGNSVEMDSERAEFADNTVHHEAAMRFLTAQIKTMLAALGS